MKHITATTTASAVAAVAVTLAAADTFGPLGYVVAVALLVATAAAVTGRTVKGEEVL